MKILNSDFYGAFTTLELIWYMQQTGQRRASVAAEALTYSLQEIGRKPSRAIKQIIFVRKCLLEGRIVLPENVYVPTDIESNDEDDFRPPAAPWANPAEALDALRDTLPRFSDRQYSDLLARCPPTPAAVPTPLELFAISPQGIPVPVFFRSTPTSNHPNGTKIHDSWTVRDGYQRFPPYNSTAAFRGTLAMPHLCLDHRTLDPTCQECTIHANWDSGLFPWPEVLDTGPEEYNRITAPHLRALPQGSLLTNPGNITNLDPPSVTSAQPDPTYHQNRSGDFRLNHPGWTTEWTTTTSTTTGPPHPHPSNTFTSLRGPPPHHSAHRDRVDNRPNLPVDQGKRYPCPPHRHWTAPAQSTPCDSIPIPPFLRHITDTSPITPFAAAPPPPPPPPPNPATRTTNRPHHTTRLPSRTLSGGGDFRLNDPLFLCSIQHFSTTESSHSTHTQWTPAKAGTARRRLSSPPRSIPSDHSTPNLAPHSASSAPLPLLIPYSLTTGLTLTSHSTVTVSPNMAAQGYIEGYRDERVSISTHSETASMGGTIHPRGTYADRLLEVATNMAPPTEEAEPEPTPNERRTSETQSIFARNGYTPITPITPTAYPGTIRHTDRRDQFSRETWNSDDGHSSDVGPTPIDHHSPQSPQQSIMEPSESPASTDQSPPESPTNHLADSQAEETPHGTLHGYIDGPGTGFLPPPADTESRGTLPLAASTFTAPLAPPSPPSSDPEEIQSWAFAVTESASTAPAKAPPPAPTRPVEIEQYHTQLPSGSASRHRPTVAIPPPRTIPQEPTREPTGENLESSPDPSSPNHLRLHRPIYNSSGLSYIDAQFEEEIARQLRAQEHEDIYGPPHIIRHLPDGTDTSPTNDQISYNATLNYSLPDCQICLLPIGPPNHSSTHCPFLCTSCKTFQPLIINTFHNGGVLHNTFVKQCVNCHMTNPIQNPARPNHSFASDIATVPSLILFPSPDPPTPAGSSSSPPPINLPQPPWWLCSTSTSRIYADAVIREFETANMAEDRYIDEATRVGTQVMTVTETTTPERPPRGLPRSYHPDSPDHASADSLTPDHSPTL